MNKLVVGEKYITSIKYNEFIIDNGLIVSSLKDFFGALAIPDVVKDSYFDFLSLDNTGLREQLNYFFDHPYDESLFTPLFIYSERRQEIITILADRTDIPEEPGEPGSVLAYVRFAMYGEDVLCSDCYGQLSCSSCAVEVIQGQLKNPVPRDEEFDMLSIDPDMIPTSFSRLSCQSVVDIEPLFVIIRSYG